MISPIVHTNGTSPEELLSQLSTAISALDEALHALGHAAPNGRDYYVLGPGAIKQAVSEHRDRIDRVYSVKAELYSIYEMVCAETERRRR